MLGGIGLGLSALGGTVQSFGNMKANNDARKRKIQGYQQALNDFNLGSTDVQGNRINWDSNKGWNYNLSNPGRAQVLNTNRNTYLANTLGNISPRQAANQLTASQYLASKMQANANQSAAYRQALRTASNLKDVQNGLGQTNSSTLRQIMQQNLLKGLDRQAQIQDAYLTNAVNAQNSVANLQNNLANLQATLGGAKLAQQNAIADAKAIPVTNMLQTLGKIASGIGQGMSDYQTGNQQISLEALKALIGLSNPEDKNNPQVQKATQFLLDLFNKYRGSF